MAPETGRFRVATFNLHHCKGSDGAIDVARVGDVISRLNADVIAFQEVDRNLPRSGSLDQAVKIQEATDLVLLFHSTVHRAGGDYGIAFGSRKPASAEVVELPGGDGSEPRAAFVATVDLLGGRITVIATHLERAKYPRIQDLQLAHLAKIVSTGPGPTILMGDLNRGPQGLKVLLDAGLRPAVAAPTFPARSPRRQLDHILVSARIGVAGGGSIRTDRSDHLPLWADLEISR